MTNPHNVSSNCPQGDNDPHDDRDPTRCAMCGVELDAPMDDNRCVSCRLDAAWERSDEEY